MQPAGRTGSRPGSRGPSSNGNGFIGTHQHGPAPGVGPLQQQDLSNHTFTSRHSGITEESMASEAQLVRQFSTYDVDGQVENPEGLQLRLQEANAMADAVNASIRSVRSNRSQRNEASNHRHPLGSSPFAPSASTEALSGIAHNYPAAAYGSAHGGMQHSLYAGQQFDGQGRVSNGSTHGGVQHAVHGASELSAHGGSGSTAVAIDMQPSLSRQLSAALVSAAAAHARQQRLSGQAPSTASGVATEPSQLLHQLQLLHHMQGQQHSLYSPHHHQALQNSSSPEVHQLQPPLQQQLMLPQTPILPQPQQQLQRQEQQERCLCCGALPLFDGASWIGATASAPQDAAGKGGSSSAAGAAVNSSIADGRLKQGLLGSWRQKASSLWQGCHACTSADVATWFVTYCSKFGGNLDTRMPPESCATLLSSWLGAFMGIIAVSALQHFVTPEVDLTLMIASFGATAVLIYGVPTSKMASPRNVMGGHLISALIGAIVRLIFKNLPWVAAPFGMATALLCMQLLSLTHPPGGATALIAASTEIIGPAHGFALLLTVLFGMLIMLSIAALHNNLWPARRYPTFWY